MKKFLLVVDDNPDVHATVAALIERHSLPFRLWSFYSATEARCMYEPDAQLAVGLLLDDEMESPVAGREVCPELRKRLPDAAWIFYVGQRDPSWAFPVGSWVKTFDGTEAILLAL